MIRSAVCVAVIAASVLNVAAASNNAPPTTLSLTGGSVLPTAGHAQRALLLGAVATYAIAVYFDGPLADRGRLASPDLPKALRIEITFVDDPRRTVAVDWRRELVPVLDAGATAHLRGIFAPVRDGDVLVIEYVPGRGTSVRVNKSIAVEGAHHDLMLTFLDHWLGERPVSEELKRALLGS